MAVCRRLQTDLRRWSDYRTDAVFLFLKCGVQLCINGKCPPALCARFFCRKGAGVSGLALQGKPIRFAAVFRQTSPKIFAIQQELSNLSQVAGCTSGGPVAGIGLPRRRVDGMVA